MKVRRLFVAVLMGLLVATTVQGQSPVFSIKPGLGVQSSLFGLQIEQIMPYLGFDLLAIGVDEKYSETDWRRDGQTGNMYRSFEEERDMSGSATLLMPHIGVQYLFPQEELRPYCFGGIFKSFAFVSVKGENIYRSYNPEGQLIDENINKLELEDEEEEIIEELLGVWGINLGFGVEYPLSERFSIAGEYMLRLYFTSADYADKDSGDWDGDGRDDWREEWEGELSGSLKMSQAAVVLSFHF